MVGRAEANAGVGSTLSSCREQGDTYETYEKGRMLDTHLQGCHILEQQTQRHFLDAEDDGSRDTMKKTLCTYRFPFNDGSCFKTNAASCKQAWINFRHTYDTLQIQMRGGLVTPQETEEETASPDDITVVEASRIIEVNPDTICAWIRHGFVRAHKVGKVFYFSKFEFAELKSFAGYGYKYQNSHKNYAKARRSR